MHRRQTATWEGGRTRSLSSQLPSTLRSPKYVDPAPSCKALRAAGLLCGQLLVSAMALARSTAVSQCILCISDASARARRSQTTCGATQLLVHVLRLVAPTRPTIASRQAGSVLRIDSQVTTVWTYKHVVQQSGRPRTPESTEPRPAAAPACGRDHACRVPPRLMHAAPAAEVALDLDLHCTP